MKDSIPDLQFERITDGLGEGLILLTQDDNGDPGRVAIHPLHLRYMAQQFGLIQSSDPQQIKTIQTLHRRLNVISTRLTELTAWMATHSDHEHADLSNEMTRLNALCDLAQEWAQEWLPGMAEGAQAVPTKTPAQASLL